VAAEASAPDLARERERGGRERAERRDGLIAIGLAQRLGRCAHRLIERDPPLGLLRQSPPVGQELIQVRAQDPHPARADPNRRQVPAVDHVSDRLLVELEQLGDLGNRQILVIWHRLSLIEPVDAGGRLQGSRRSSWRPTVVWRVVSDRSAIEWTEASWNPTTGCNKVSPGCAHCYAETFAERFRGVPGHPYRQGFDLRLWPERLEIPLRWRRPRLIFVNSMSDLFHESIPDEFIRDVFDVMGRADWHTFQILTKRHDRLAALAPDLDWHPNVWMGVTIENRRFTHRADRLREVPAAVRFISAEPLLGPLEGLDLAAIDWLIAGGESGAGHRPVKPEWITDLRDRCATEDVRFFFKQWGGWRPKARGRDLEGRTWDELPNGGQRTTPVSAVRAPSPR
jgi:protein gp37